MKPPPIPGDEQQRLADLKGLSLLDTPAEERFDRITRLARKALHVPIALVSLVDQHRQWFKSRQGLKVSETPRVVSFCGHAIAADGDIFLIEDATKDERFHDNPIVTGEPGVRFYAGRSLRSPAGHSVGTLCVIDRVPRQFNQDDLDVLDDLAKYAEMEFRLDALNETERALRQMQSEVERRASIDPLTQLWNRAMIDRVLSGELKRAVRDNLSLTLMFADIDRLGAINNSHGRAFGDEVVRQAARRSLLSLRSYDSCGRYGGNVFMVVLPSCDIKSAERIGERICNRVRLTPVILDDIAIPVTLSVGACVVQPTDPSILGDLIKRTDELLQQAKQAGGNRLLLESLTP